MSSELAGQLIALGSQVPTLDPRAWVAQGAVVIGSVVLGPHASVWYGSVLRGDGDLIEVGANSNVQDACVLHTDPGHPVRVGAGVTVGHRAVLHGCTVEDDALVGMGAIVLNGATVGSGSLIAAGAVLPEGMDVPPGVLVAGVPGKVRRHLTSEESQALRQSSRDYVALVERHRAEARLL